MDDPLNLMLFICEYFERQDFVQQQLLDKVQMSLDPAKLVLEAIQVFHPIRSRKHERRFDSAITKRSCLLMLHYLSEASPVITPQVKEAAIILATEWKNQLRASTNYVYEVLALLRFIVVYELTPGFCPNELEDLVKSLSEHGETNELQVFLGLSGELCCEFLHLLLAKLPSACSYFHLMFI